MDITAQNAKQFVEQDKVPLIIGYTDSDSVLPTGPTIQAAKIPFITVGATSPKLPTQIGDMMFLACFGDNVQAAVGAEYSFEKFGKNAYFLWDKGVEYTTLLGQYFKSRFTELGGKIVLEDSYDDEATDFSAQITKIKALPDQAGLLLRRGDAVQRRPGRQAVPRRRDRPDRSSAATAMTRRTWSTVAGAAANNVFFTTHALMDATGGTDGIKKFIADYKAEYGNDPENAFAALGYDTVYLLADAVKRAGGTDSAAVKTAIEATKDFKGITGSMTFARRFARPAEGRDDDRRQGRQVHARRGGRAREGPAP